MSKINNKRLKRRLEKSNPKLVSKTSWIFSGRRQRMLNYLFGIMLFLFLILMWTNAIVIPIK